MRVDAIVRQDTAYTFHLPAVPRTLKLASRDAVPAEFGIARDERPLGVAFRSVAFRQGTRFTVWKARDERFIDGFHRYEEDGNLRWTAGLASLPVEALSGFSGAVEVVVLLAATSQYLDDGRYMAA